MFSKIDFNLNLIRLVYLKSNERFFYTFFASFCSSGGTYNVSSNIAATGQNSQKKNNKISTHNNYIMQEVEQNTVNVERYKTNTIPTEVFTICLNLTQKNYKVRVRP